MHEAINDGDVDMKRHSSLGARELGGREAQQVELRDEWRKQVADYGEQLDQARTQQSLQQTLTALRLGEILSVS